MAFLTLGFLAFVPNRPITLDKSLLGEVLEHWTRLVVIFVFVVLVTLYFTVPFVLDREHFDATNFFQANLDSFGHWTILGGLVKGNLFDLDRFPSFSLLVFAGIGTCIFYRHKNSYLIPLIMFFLWLCLFFGRPTWGPAIDLLPFSQNIHMHRFIAGVHLSGILLAATALGIPWRWALSRGDWRYIVGALTLTILILAPVYIERRAYLSENAMVIQAHQQEMRAERADIDKIIETLNGLPPGRVYAGLRPFDSSTEFGDRWGHLYQIGGTPVADILSTAGLDVFGSAVQRYSLASGVIGSFDENSPAQYNLFNIKYLVVPDKSEVPDFMEPVNQFGRHEIYQVETTGYFDIVGSHLQLFGEQSTHSPAARAWLESGLHKLKRHPQVSINGSPKLQELGTRPSTIISTTTVPTESSLSSFSSQIDLNPYIAEASAGPPRGLIISEDMGPNYYSTTVNVKRESMLMLKVSYHPNWRVTVDGSEYDPVMLIPGFIGIQLAPGKHNVIMEYRSRELRKILIGLGLLTLMSIWLLEKKLATVSSVVASRFFARDPGPTEHSRDAQDPRKRGNRR